VAKHTFHFRTYASDETENWNLPAAMTGASAFGLYFFLEGEATHICSFEANSRVEFLENVFLNADDPDAMQAHLDGPGDDLRTENGGEWTSYFGFIDVTRKSVAPYIGPRESFTLDSNDYTLDAELYAATVAKSLRFHVSPQQAHADARRECLREFAYEAAREEFGMNSPSEPPVFGAAALAAHKSRAAMRAAEYEERHTGGPPLFAAAGISAPLALSPS
jgi:hypothetical protein